MMMRRSGAAFSDPSPASPPGLPFSGEIIAWLATALRLRDVRGGVAEYSESTAKRIARAEPGVSDENRGALLQSFVEHFFTPAYLAARGLEPTEAVEHNAVVVVALEGLLAKWDEIVGISNHVGPAYTQGVLVGFGGNFFLDLSIRIGVYLAHFGRILPAARRAGAWAREDGLRAAFRELCQRADSRCTDAELIRRSKLQKNTLRGIKSGESIPLDETILKLAGGLAEIGKRAGRGVGCPTEIAVELRFACAVAKIRELGLSSPELSQSIGGYAHHVTFFANDLRRYTTIEKMEILTKGTGFHRWAEVRARLERKLIAVRLQMEAAMEAEENARHATIMRIAEKDPATARRMMAQRVEHSARELHRMMESTPDLKRGLAGEMLEIIDMAARVLTSDEGQGPLSDHLSHMDTLKSKSLCDDAIAPWNWDDPKKQEALCKQAIELDPACAQARFYLAILLARDQACLPEAIFHLDAALRVDEDFHEARLLLAGLLVQQGAASEALEHMEEARSRGCSSARGSALHGRILIELDRAPEARTHFEESLRDSPRNPDAHSGLAHIFAKLGDEKKARHHAQAAKQYGGRSTPETAFGGSGLTAARRN